MRHEVALRQRLRAGAYLPNCSRMTSDTDQDTGAVRPAEAVGAEEAGLDIPPTPEQLMQAAAARIAALEAEVAELRERWMRAEAETQNVRARGKREVDETRQYAV